MLAIVVQAFRLYFNSTSRGRGPRNSAGVYYSVWIALAAGASARVCELATW